MFHTAYLIFLVAFSTMKAVLTLSNGLHNTILAYISHRFLVRYSAVAVGKGSRIIGILHESQRLFTNALRCQASFFVHCHCGGLDMLVNIYTNFHNFDFSAEYYTIAYLEMWQECTSVCIYCNCLYNTCDNSSAGSCNDCNWWSL